MTVFEPISDERLAENVAGIRRVLERESQHFGRPPRLIAVTKYVSGSQALRLLPLGVTDIGENRVQVLREKLPEISGKFSVHLIGRLQTNKVKYIMKDVCMIHSADRMDLCREIDRQARLRGVRMDVLVEMNITGERQKGGIGEEALASFIREASLLPGIRLKGLMTMMPLDAPRAYIFERFTHMRTLLDRARDTEGGQEMTELSMGMSQDYDLAARAGATMVRVGSALWT